MDLHTHYMDLINKEHQKLRTLKTRPWAFSQWLLSKGEAEGRWWLWKVSYVVLLALYTTAGGYFFVHAEPMGEGFSWIAAVVIYVLGAVVVYLIGWVAIADGVFALLKGRSVVPASSDDITKITQHAEKFDWFREVVVNLLAREGTGQLTHLQARALLYHYDRIDHWSVLEATRLVGMKHLEEKTGVVSHAESKVRAKGLEETLPPAVEAPAVKPRF